MADVEDTFEQLFELTLKAWAKVLNEQVIHDPFTVLVENYRAAHRASASQHWWAMPRNFVDREKSARARTVKVEPQVREVPEGGFVRGVYREWVGIRVCSPLSVLGQLYDPPRPGHLANTHAGLVELLNEAGLSLDTHPNGREFYRRLWWAVMDYGFSIPPVPSRLENYGRRYDAWEQERVAPMRRAYYGDAWFDNVCKKADVPLKGTVEKRIKSLACLGLAYYHPEVKQ